MCVAHTCRRSCVVTRGAVVVGVQRRDEQVACMARERKRLLGYVDDAAGAALALSCIGFEVRDSMRCGLVTHAVWSTGGARREVVVVKTNACAFSPVLALSQPCHWCANAGKIKAAADALAVKEAEIHDCE